MISKAGFLSLAFSASCTALAAPSFQAHPGPNGQTFYSIECSVTNRLPFRTRVSANDAQSVELAVASATASAKQQCKANELNKQDPDTCDREVKCYDAGEIALPGKNVCATEVKGMEFRGEGQDLNLLTIDILKECRSNPITRGNSEECERSFVCNTDYKGPQLSHTVVSTTQARNASGEYIPFKKQGEDTNPTTLQLLKECKEDPKIAHAEDCSAHLGSRYLRRLGPDGESQVEIVSMIDLDSKGRVVNTSFAAASPEEKLSRAGVGGPSQESAAAARAIVAQAAINGAKFPSSAVPTLKPSQPQEEGLHRKLWVVSAEYLGLQFLGLGALSLLPKSDTLWGRGGIDVMVDNFVAGPRFDFDRFHYNFLSHPLVGMQTYLLARNRDHEWYTSLVYSTLASGVWEFGIEGYYERASVQDLIITPAAGAVLGEAVHQIKNALRNKDGKVPSTAGKVLMVVLDPIDALTGGLKW
jgi:hypothetical protein